MRSPDDAEVVYALGLVHLKYRRNQRARDLFERALAVDPNFASAREKLEEIERALTQRPGSGR